MPEAVREQKVNQECLLGECCDIREIVPVVLREPEDLFEEKLAVLLAEKLVPNLERADFQYLRPGAFGARLAMRLVLADNEARNVTVQLKDPALAVLLPAFVEPRVKAGVVPAKAFEDGVGLVYLIRFALDDVRQIHRLHAEQPLYPLERFLDGENVGAEIGAVSASVETDILRDDEIGGFGIEGCQEPHVRPVVLAVDCAEPGDELRLGLKRNAAKLLEFCEFADRHRAAPLVLVARNVVVVSPDNE